MSKFAVYCYSGSGKEKTSGIMIIMKIIIFIIIIMII